MAIGANPKETRDEQCGQIRKDADSFSNEPGGEEARNDPDYPWSKLNAWEKLGDPFSKLDPWEKLNP